MAATPFFWGGGGARLTPADIAAQRRMAQALFTQGADYSPVQSPWQGAARMAQGLLGGYQMGELDRASAANSSFEQNLIAAYLANQAGGAAAAPAAPASPVASALANPMGGNVTVPPVSAALTTPRAEVAPSSKVWGDKEAEAAGLYEPKATPAAMPIAAPAAAAPPVQTMGMVQPMQVAGMMATSPYVSDETRAFGMKLLQSQMAQQQQANDPLRKLQIRGAELANTKAERDLQGDGAVPLTAEERTAYGIPTTQSAYKTRSGEIKFGPAGTNVNVDTGTIPQGYQAVRDANGRVTKYDIIPGGPEDKTKQDAAKAENRATSTDIITGAAEKARAAIKGATLPATGSMGSLLSNIGETGAAEVYRQVDAIKANAKVEALQAMRAASPTGGALGAVSDSENAMLAAKAGALDPKSPNFLRDLADYERTLLRVIHGKEAGDNIYSGSRPDVGWQDVGGVKIRKKQ